MTTVYECSSDISSSGERLLTHTGGDPVPGGAAIERVLDVRRRCPTRTIVHGR
ncbi:hypothetical protein [Amycolatopsis cihanbeyliensis]|uniref:Uncharacterized protein n=1 Tax=Amycolatopsis cihanbeyliensis TaxID=1128664 RepID=A0A542DQD9_AMYCI|nr:hypothetical protein [Amycolatopsis cihanbeyliensis]TQJ05204.1 hypothetical protein FB471_5031 [Amycolatopsis cihanbeyliensis]